MDLSKWVDKASKSNFYRYIFNIGLSRLIPFNKPHKFTVVEISKAHLKLKLPYQKRNLNHVKGLHACALATLAEMSTGLLLISNLDPKKYRLILQKLELEYHYQGKTDAFAEYTLDSQFIEHGILNPLTVQESVLVPCEVKIFDTNQNHLATGRPVWQIKDWKKVKTKVA